MHQHPTSFILSGSHPFSIPSSIPSERDIVANFIFIFFFGRDFTSTLVSSQSTADVFVQFSSPLPPLQHVMLALKLNIFCCSKWLPFSKHAISFFLETDTSPQDKQQTIEHYIPSHVT